MQEIPFRLNDNEQQTGYLAQLTDWPKPPTIIELKRDFEASRPAHDAILAKVTEWSDLLNVRGKEAPIKIKGRSSVQPKLVRRQAEWRYAPLSEPFLNTEKVFSVTPATFADIAGAKQNDLVLNWQFRTKLNRIKFIDDLVHTTVDEGTCVIRVGWKRVTVTVEEPTPVWDHYSITDAQSAQQFQQSLAAKQQDPRAFEAKAPPEIQQAVSYYEESGQPTVARQSGTQMVPTVKVIENRPTVEVLHPMNVFIDPSCNGDLDRAKFAVISFETCKAELAKEPEKYKNLNYVNWQANSPASEPNHYTTTPPDFAIQDEARRIVVGYEYWGLWDINGDGKLTAIVATWIGDVLIRMEVNPYPDEKIPLVVIPYMPKKRELFGEPDAEILGDNQRILGAVTRGVIDLLGKSANGQKGIAKNLLDALNRRRYENGEDYEFNPGQNPVTGIIEHKFPELPQSALQVMGMVNQDAEGLTGVKSFSGGLSGNAYGDIATNTRSVLDAASMREMSILRRLAQGVIEIGTKIIAMNAVFLSEEETVHVTGEIFVPVRREDLKGNFQVIVDINTAEVDNAKASDLAFMLQTCGPNVGPDIMLLILSKIADLKRMPDLAHTLSNYKPPPDPFKEQMQQLQIQQLQLQCQLLQSQIGLTGSKTHFEGSRTDLNNLNYVEQETGTKHVRDMQKQEAQSRGNQNLEVTKALTTPRKEGETPPNLNAAIGFNALSSRM